MLVLLSFGLPPVRARRLELVLGQEAQDISLAGTSSNGGLTPGTPGFPESQLSNGSSRKW